jgi:ribosomal protein S18 acetylase RimI-like enzyme
MTCTMNERPWQLRPACPADRDFLYALNEATMREHAEKVWGWDEAEQAVFFDNRFRPDDWQVIQADGQDIGVLIVEEDDEQIYLAEIQILPESQGRGIGSVIVRELMQTATATGKPLTLRVLHVNSRARALYERLGFRQFKEIETHAYLRWDPAA